MIKGETVTVQLRQFGAVDAYGNPAKSYTAPAQVDNVLIGRRTPRTDETGAHPYAIEDGCVFCFPRDYTGDLRGALIIRDGRVYEVDGDPMEYTAANLPPLLPWNIRVEAVRRDG